MHSIASAWTHTVVPLQGTVTSSRSSLELEVRLGTLDGQEWISGLDPTAWSTLRSQLAKRNGDQAGVWERDVMLSNSGVRVRHDAQGTCVGIRKTRLHHETFEGFRVALSREDIDPLSTVQRAMHDVSMSRGKCMYRFGWDERRWVRIDMSMVWEAEGAHAIVLVDDAVREGYAPSRWECELELDVAAAVASGATGEEVERVLQEAVAWCRKAIN